MGGIKRAAVMAVLVSIALMGCGGGGGGGGSSSSSSSSSGRPTIQGQPSTVVLPGTAYSFQPVANDSNGDRLTFTASNLPAWLSLNASTGRLTGTPTANDLGTYSGLTITVSDGSNTAVLGPFSITVTNSGSGSASLSWTPPDANTDGSVLRDLTGFVIVYGTTPDQLSLSVAIDNPSVSRYVVENLTAGTWYFAVQAVNATGMRSALSGVASTTIS